MIRVVDRWVIDSDGKTFTGGKLATRILKDGTKEEYIKDAFYHSSLAGCVEAISRRMRAEAIKNTDGGIEDALAAVQAADMRLIKAIEKFNEIRIVDRKNE